MVAGRELDAEIAKLMGLTVKLMYDPGFVDIGPWYEVDGESDPPGAISGWCPVAYYSTSIAAAWEVWDKLIVDGWYPDLTTTYSAKAGGLVYGCELQRGGDGTDDHYWVQAETAPLAICECALKAMAASIPLTAPPEKGV